MEEMYVCCWQVIVAGFLPSQPGVTGVGVWPAIIILTYAIVTEGGEGWGGGMK
jgi:hypothetical protein